MAMIQCPDCGKEVSDKATKCIYCNKVLNEGTPTTKFCSECGKEVPSDAVECKFCGGPFEPVNNIDSKGNKPKSIKKIMIPIIIVALLAIIAVMVFKFMGSNLSKDEQLAYQNAVNMKSMMKDPDSFKLYDEMFLLKFHGDNGKVLNTYTVFKYGGANGYGAITTDEAVFKDDKFVMNYADKPDEKDSNYDDQIKTQAMLATYVLSYDDDAWEKVDIDIEKIKNKMGLK